MSSWGIESWGISSWGDAIKSAIMEEPITGGLSIVYRSPIPDQIDVLENAMISIWFFDPTYDLNITSIVIFIDDSVIYTGTTGFIPEYAGSTVYRAGTFQVQFTKRSGFSFRQRVQIKAYAEDLATNYTQSVWSWRVRENPYHYAGLQPLPIEIALQAPFETFLELEPLRQIFLANALRPQTQAISNAGNKAARVLYQLAFATELSTLQNPYNTKNAEALATRIAEKQHALAIDKALAQYKDRVRSGIGSLQQQGALPESYTNAFADYADSSLFIYRVSLVANMLLFAKSYELQQA